MKESEIRPPEIFNEYLRLAEKDVKDFFSDCSYVEVACPACSSAGKFEFEKKGFDYKLCGKCKTLFVSPRPGKEAFIRYYLDAPSTRYWAEHFYKETESARRKSIFRPKSKLVLEKINKYAANAGWLLDIGAGYGTFLEEFKKMVKQPFTAIAVEPSDSLSKVCSKKGLIVIKKFMEELGKGEMSKILKGRGVFTSFELLEHIHTPVEFLSSCREKMSKGDILIFTTLSGTGFDLQLLWEKSQSIFPPHHLNFFNPGSIKILLTKSGLDALEITTPGKLDVDIAINNIQYVNDRFFKTFLEMSDCAAREGFQSFLQDNNLSSHMMVVAKKNRK